MIRLPGMNSRVAGADMLGDDLVAPRKRKSPGTGAQANLAPPKFRLKTDADLGYAGRGRMPAWMEKMMTDSGIDPKDKDAVSAWKDENLVEA
jgi:DNA-binding protein H-NS